MVSIELKDLEFYAYHGVGESEGKTGGPYLVNLVVRFEEGSASFEDLQSTIDYVALFDIIKQRMSVSTPLLEKVAESIIRRIKHQYSSVKEIQLSIYKLQAPIENLKGKVGITLHKRFND